MNEYDRTVSDVCFQRTCVTPRTGRGQLRIMPDLGLDIWLAALAIAGLAGFIKGLVGFAMPMIMFSGVASLASPDIALAALIIPTLATNLWQALRDGLHAAIGVALEHWRFFLVLWVGIAVSAQLVYVLSQEALLLILGVPVTFFAALQLFGWRLRFPPSARRVVEFVVASIAGFLGGLSGVWGPPTVAYLTALETPKVAQVRLQGIIYGSGAVVLVFAHVRSGLFTGETAIFSGIFLVPALLGMAVGFRVQDRLDQQAFRTATLVVLVVAGLNLIRRGLLG